MATAVRFLAGIFTSCTNLLWLAQITFLIPQGNVSAMDVIGNADILDSVTLRIIAGNHQSSTIDPTYHVQDGTTEYIECSGRGICDYSSGSCNCFDSFMSSDGLGAQGSRGDCGHFYWNINNYPTDLFCPYAINLDTNASELCSGHGSCDSGSCVCDTGYGWMTVCAIFNVYHI